MPRSDVILVDTLAAAVAVGVKPGMVRKWAHYGWLTRLGADNRRRTLYSLAEVHDVHRGHCLMPQPSNKVG